MSPSLTSLTDEALNALETLASRATGLVNPSIRLGVTGLSRAGKTVFISSLVHNLVHGGRLPLFEASQSGRIARVHLDPQPDDAVPRFQYEDHIRDLVKKRIWPDSTRSISELRLTIHYQSASGWNRIFSPGRLSIDIVDYPGEWLMDLPLLSMSYKEFSDHALDLARRPSRLPLSEKWLSLAAAMDPAAAADETAVRELTEAFTNYLKACKSDERSFSALAPGRFLMPGDLEGSPALTFAPLPDLADKTGGKGSLLAMMERRYESYKSIVVRPFFREHFTRLDRQIVLVDTLSALNRGPEALTDLEGALSDVLSCFRPGTNSFLSSIVSRRIDRVLVAATKADHLHHESHDRLERITRRLVERAIDKVGMSGAAIDVLALASVRSTREGVVERAGEPLPVIVGTPMQGETIDGDKFDGKRKTAIFPGDLRENSDSYFQGAGSFSERGPAKSASEQSPEINIVRFRPPALEENGGGLHLSIPHIRLDRALQFLIGDRLA